jgi:dTDP-4-amino-4,6-dideoxygalactose transaminase
MNISIDRIKAAITPKTKAIVPVHLFGRALIWRQLWHWLKNIILCNRDNAQAIGANCSSSFGPKKAGTIGHVGATSFFPSKKLGCYGDGGAIFTNDDALAHTSCAV